MKLRIDVKKSHIKNGKRDSGKYCPIALAYKSATKSNSFFYVSSDKIRGYDNNDKYFVALLPNEAKQFIKKFDSLKPKNKFVPFSFEIEIYH